MLEGLYRMTRDEKNAATASEHVAILKRLPPEVVQATSLFSDGELAHAESIVRAYLLNMATTSKPCGSWRESESRATCWTTQSCCSRRCSTLAPDYRAARHDYALTLVERHKYQQARDELEKLLQLEPENRHYRTLYATACVGLGEHEKAIPTLPALLDGMPQAADLHLSIAHSFKTYRTRR